ncbi:MAG: hypothetical protein PWQ96_906 [Clostridia bacterium]|nr:hypothetical protein [Clostridiales bacterium]MDK2985264.1 hypothetical protein [Clostridia bacterium]
MLVLWGIIFVIGIFLALGYYVERHKKDPGEKEFPVNNFPMEGKNVLNARANRKIIF